MKWEYATAVMEPWIMSELGSEGWELVSVIFEPNAISHEKYWEQRHIHSTQHDGMAVGYFKRRVRFWCRYKRKV